VSAELLPKDATYVGPLSFSVTQTRLVGNGTYTCRWVGEWEGTITLDVSYATGAGRVRATLQGNLAYPEGVPTPAGSGGCSSATFSESATLRGAVNNAAFRLSDGLYTVSGTIGTADVVKGTVGYAFDYMNDPNHLSQASGQGAYNADLAAPLVAARAAERVRGSRGLADRRGDFAGTSRSAIVEARRFPGPIAPQGHSGP
jgi:hypothetical protein